MNPLPTESEPVKHLCGDALETLRTLPDGCVHTCVTSPPYYGLRDYGTARWEGGDPACDHKPKRLKKGRNENRPTFGDSYATHGTQLIAHGKRTACDKCGATKTDLQVGLEESPEAYVARLVEVFREVRRVLRDDGTLWLNLGDSYANDAASQHDPGPRLEGRANVPTPQKSWRVEGIKKKDLLGIPWMVAFALRADGWYLRSDIIWAKPNPQPESVTDRCTKAHEYLFMLAKSPTYFFDQAAIAEPCTGSTLKRISQPNYENQKGSARTGKKNGPMKAVVAKVNGGACFGKQRASAAGTGAQSRTYSRPVYLTRNRRSVWVVTPARFKGAHFATFPRELVEPCIRACCPAGGIVLDPFAGSGTTLRVARDLGRLALGIDLNPEYHELIKKRLAA